MRSLLAMVLLSILAAGCVSPPGAELDAASVAEAEAALAAGWDRVRGALSGVPCEAPVMDATSENLLPLGILRSEEYGAANLDAWGDFLVLGQPGSVQLVSVHDPMAPRIVARYAGEDGYGDAKFLGEGRYVAVARSDWAIEILDVSATTLAPAGSLPQVEPVSEEIASVSLGIWEYPPPPPGHLLTNMHMLETARIGEDDYVFVAPNDDTGVWWFRVDVEAAEGATSSASFETMEPIGFPLAGGPLGPHDMTVAHDEILDAPILYIANGFEGWQAWDLREPSSPERLLVLPNLGPGQAYTHTVAAGKVGERRIVVTIAEVGSNTMRIFDATDFARPVLLAEWWANKADPAAPQHDINIVGDHLTMGHYSRGAYVFDLAALGSAPLLGSLDIAPIARFVPVNPMSQGVGGTGLLTDFEFANVFDVVTLNGVLYVSDFTDPENAVTAVGFGCLPAGDRSLVST